MLNSQFSTALNTQEDDLVFSVLHNERPYQPFHLDFRIGLNNYSLRWLRLLRSCVEYEITRGTALGTFMGYTEVFINLIQISFEDGVKDCLSSDDLLVINATASRRNKQQGLRSILERAFERPELGRRLFDHTVNKRIIGCLIHKQDSNKTVVTSIVNKALSPATYASLWAQLEIALADKKITNSQFVYFAVQATTNARDANLWPCKVSDLVELQTTDSNGATHLNWYLRIYLAKARLDRKQDAGSLQPLPKEVGDRLDLHRKEVIARLGPHFPDRINEIGLFPSFFWQEMIDGTNPRLSTGNTTEHHKLEWYALMGRFSRPSMMANSYYKRIFKLIGRGLVGTQVIRHTAGTYLARLGYDARTIARILQHTDNTSAQFYVDICFAGILDEFGEKFEQQTSPILGPLIKRVENLVRKNDGSYDQKQIVQARVGHEIVTTGVCKTNRCEGVPFQCYLCPSQSFIPFSDGDHRSILNDLIEYRDEVLPHRSTSFQLETNNINALVIRIEAVIQACDAHNFNCSGDLNG